MADHTAHNLLPAKEGFQDLAASHPRCGNNVLRSAKFLSRWRLEIANEEPAEPSRPNRRRMRLFFCSALHHRLVQSGGVNRVRSPQVIQALSDAPCGFMRLPVDLSIREPAGKSSR